MTQVINIRYAPNGWQSNPDYVYIGRAGKGQDGYFGNPFRLEDGEQRGSTLELFREWVVGRMAIDEEYRRRVIELKGKTLVCFCAPQDGLIPSLDEAICHGQILAEITELL